jgi:hypothetical protein
MFDYQTYYCSFLNLLVLPDYIVFENWTMIWLKSVTPN